MIFDFNGVLVDDEHLHFELFREALSARGISLSESKYFEEYVGFDDAAAFSEAFRSNGLPLDSHELACMIRAKARSYLDRAARSLKYFEGAEACVREMARSWPVAINSGALRDEIEFSLRNLDLHDIVSVIVSAEDTERSKPDPEGYLLALDALRAVHGEDLEAGHCAVVEDTAAGVQAAKAAGMWVIGITNTTEELILRSAGADVVRSSLVGMDRNWVRSLFAPEISP